MLEFEITASDEGRYRMRFFDSNANMFLESDIYAVDHDLAERMPLRGDFHLHSCRSDGHQDPGTVVAYYRGHGYDFCFITDHERYYPSLEAIDIYSKVNAPIKVYPGEEVHLKGTDTHIINAGGLFSVNGLFRYLANYRESAGDIDKRRFDKSIQPPPIMTDELYERELEEIKKEFKDCPSDVDIHSFAVCVWAFRKIREAGGLAIYVHPFWVSDMWNVTEKMNAYMFEKHPFDAFEVLGGELYYMQNGLQTAYWYKECADGRVHPILGSTDSHDCTDNNPAARLCSTIVFAHENTREDILSSVKDLYSVAVDTISKEYRLVGSYRLQKYSCFLMDTFYELHDRLAATDGEILRQYYIGEESSDTVEHFTEKADRFMKKYIKMI